MRSEVRVELNGPFFLGERDGEREKRERKKKKVTEGVAGVVWWILAS